MASKTSKTEAQDGAPERRMSFDDFAARLAKRRAELGNPELPRNSGNRRTQSKRALLAAVEATGKRW